MTFEQEIAKALIGALATAFFVTVLGGWMASKLTARGQIRRQEFETKAALVERASQVAQKMFVVCQHTRRILRDHVSATETDSRARRDALADLDSAYREFSAQSAALETVLGARYGVTWNSGGDPMKDAKPSQSPSRVFWRWHQIRDLLTLYYFNLTGSFPGDALKRNSKGHGGRFHSGFDAVGLVEKPMKPTPEGLSAMRGVIRRNFDEALPDLANAIMAEKVRVG